MRPIELALILAATLTQACTVCPVESAPDLPDAAPCVDAGYVDPCAEAAPYVDVPYRDGYGVTFPAGGTVRAGNTAEHLLRFESGWVIAEVRVRVVPQRHGDIYGMVLPTIEVRERTEIGDGFVLTAEDPYQYRAATAGDPTVSEDYSKPHTVVAHPGWTTMPGSGYYITVGGEAGGGPDAEAARDYQICGTGVELVR